MLWRRTEGIHFEPMATEETPAAEECYLLLKTISHLAVRLHMVLNRLLTGEIELKQLATRLSPIQEQLLTLKNDYSKQVASELSVIKLTLATINQALDCSKTKQIKDLNERYLKEMEAHHERYGRQVCDLQLSGLNSIVLKWTSEGAFNFNSTYFILVGSRGPKQGLIEMQYFQWLRRSQRLSDMNTPSCGILYVEMLPEQMTVSPQLLIKDLARDLANQDIGESVLHSRNAMNEDVLSRHAEPILNRLHTPINMRQWCTNFWKPAQQDKPDRPKSKCPFHVMK